MISPVVGDLPVRRFAAVALSQQVLNRIVFLLAHGENHLIAVIDVASPSEDAEEGNDSQNGKSDLKSVLFHNHIFLMGYYLRTFLPMVP